MESKNDMLIRDTGLSCSYQTRDEITYIQPYDRPPGFFHVVEYDGRLGRRKGLILAKGTDGVTYTIHLVFSYTMPYKRKFEFGLGKHRQEIMDFPNYWMRITWRHPACEFWPSWFPSWLGKIIGSFDYACGVTGETLL
jgi:hypothetical protein